ncbi:MAG: GAF domain-containing protein [Oscillatoriales cyanobacterium SM2_1_8]|nr:GAF domain-containing protein [Oscillatoriales cyanobacterium SM2_1_8]
MGSHQSPSDILQQVAKLNEIGKALSAQKDLTRLMEMVLEAAKDLVQADAGTYYSVRDDRTLHFEILINDTLRVRLGGTSGNPVDHLPPLPLYRNGEANCSMVSPYAVLSRRTVNVPDAYWDDSFDFSGTREFDHRTGYRSRSFLTVPMFDNEGKAIGVLQLINAKDEHGNIVPFSAEAQSLAESLASQAAIVLTNRELIQSFKRLFEKFIDVISQAIDEKSPHTGNHCRRVPELTMMLAEAACQTAIGPLAEFTMDDDDRYELRIAGMMHDCGKVTTPVHVIEKSTKLETIFDRIHLIDTRFEVLKRDAEIAFLKAQLMGEEVQSAEATYRTQLEALDAERTYLREANIGGEFMLEEFRDLVRQIGQRRVAGPDGTEQPFLSEDEIYNLTVAKGTLTPEERKIINDHIVVTIKMLEALPYPKKLQRVPEFAGNHHEKMDGTGYPRGLKREEMSWQARMMGIADVFEALTAKDRPYKKGKPLSECLHIMGKMKERHGIDPDLFDVFVRQKVYLRYAEAFLDSEQIDEVDESAIPGYTP